MLCKIKRGPSYKPDSIAIVRRITRINRTIWQLTKNNCGESLSEIRSEIRWWQSTGSRIARARDSMRKHVFRGLLNGDALSKGYFLASVRFVRFSARVRNCFARSIAVSIGESRAFRELFRSELHACGRRRVKYWIIRDTCNMCCRSWSCPRILPHYESLLPVSRGMVYFRDDTWGVCKIVCETGSTSDIFIKFSHVNFIHFYQYFKIVCPLMCVETNYYHLFRMLFWNIGILFFALFNAILFHWCLYAQRKDPFPVDRVGEISNNERERGSLGRLLVVQINLLSPPYENLSCRRAAYRGIIMRIV